MTLRIFSDPAWGSAEAQVCPLLVPWEAEFTRAPRFSQDPYAQSGRNYFVRAGLAECDLVICPRTWRNEGDNDLVQRLAVEAKAAGKPLVVFCESDLEAPFPIPRVLVFRGSLRRSVRLPNELAAPAFFPDRLALPPASPLAGPRAKAEPPVVGFCGYIDTAADLRLPIQRVVSRALSWGILSRPKLERWLRRCGIRLTRSEGKRTRYQALGVVLRSGQLTRNIKLREHFMHGTLLQPKTAQHEYWQRAFEEFRDNILGSDYTLCPRGGGNWSYRFYETLCLGRVPVFINTDCVLPLEGQINWREYCVWVEGDEIERTAEAILAHYRSHTAESFAELQRRCRQLWLEHLSLDGFFRNFHRQPLRLG